MQGNKKSYSKEREGFQRLRDYLASGENAVILGEFEKAIAEVFEEYDTALRENRFVVGGVIEIILGAVLRAAGVNVRHKGGLDTDFDLLFDDDDSSGYSVKALLKKGQGTRLVNVMGGNTPSIERWKAATLFLLSEDVGIVYADPELRWWKEHGCECLKPTTDALQISRRCLVRFAWEQPEWVIPCKLPTADRRGTRSARTASADTASRILIHYPRLFEHVPGLRVGEEVPGRDT